MSINVIFTAENRKYMHVGFAINVIQTTKKRKYMHIELTTCSSWTHKNTFGVIYSVNCTMMETCMNSITRRGKLEHGVHKV